MLAITKVGLGLLAAVGLTTGVAMAVGPSAGPTGAVVTGHVDGDTFDVDLDGTATRIRLLNIDTPETKDPNRPVQCLGPEASTFLVGLIPVGTPVRLEFDDEREDSYGRTLAAAFTMDGRMVNVEVARAGLAQVVTFNDNVRFRPPIEQAWQEAANARRGLHSPDVDCTLPAQVKAVNDTIASAPTSATQPADLSSVDLYRAADQTGLARSAALTLLNTLTNSSNDLIWLALTRAEQARLVGDTRTAEATAAREESALRTAAGAAAAREANARAEADRVAEEKAAADRNAQEQADARATQANTTSGGATADTPDVPAPSQDTATRPRTGNSGHPCLPGERDGDGDGYCGEGR